MSAAAYPASTPAPVEYAWHVHHDLLVEPLVQPIEIRQEFIRSNKPTEEIETRLRLLKPVRGKLPEAVLVAMAAYGKARAAYDKARAAYDKAMAAYVKATAAYDKALAAYDKARPAYDKAMAAYGKAGAAYDKAGAAYDKARADCDKARADCVKAWADCVKAVEEHRAEIEALHRQECPDCPWDGKTIFPEGGGE